MPDQETLDRRVPRGELLTPRAAAVAGVAGAALAGASFAVYGATAHALVGAILGPVLAVLSAIDLRHRLLPNIIVGPAAVVIGLVVALGEPHHLRAHLAASFVAGGILFVVSLVNPAGMGMGDAKLVFLIGIALGSRTIAAMFDTAVALVAVALYLVATRGRRGLKTTIPFGPLLALGALVGYFTG